LTEAQINQLNKWRFAVDTGGTFTDVVGLDPHGTFHVLKLLSRSPEYEDASIEGMRRMLGLGPDESLPAHSVDAVRFGTTVATNALLERKGSPVGLVITQGFGDLLEIGHQSRPDIFSLCIRKPSVLYEEIVEVEERTGPDGSIEASLDRGGLLLGMERLRRKGIETVAVVLMHAWKNPEHEIMAGRILQEGGFKDVFLSHQTRNLIKIIGRGQTCLLDAYLSTVLDTYITGIRSKTGAIPVELMKSSGSLTDPGTFRGHEAILSGPAGGIVAVAGITGELGLAGAVGFDMGGTSTDVSRYDGAFEFAHERDIGGIAFQAEMLNVVTIASGGGSVLWFDGERLRVGPESAGADPGPASYALGGPPAVTDANLITGRILPEFLPRTFGPRRNMLLDAERARKALHALSREVDPSGENDSAELALGFLRVVNEQMAMAIKEISVSKGYDVRDYALVCFGGAGGQHACEVASILEISTILYHPLGGVMSAYGIGLANPSLRTERTVLLPWKEATDHSLEVSFEKLSQELPSRGEAHLRKELDIRPTGTDAFLSIPFEGIQKAKTKFREEYVQRFGFFPEDAKLEIVNLRLELTEAKDFFPAYKTAEYEKRGTDAAKENPAPLATQKVLYPDGYREAPVYDAGNISPVTSINGPALLVDKHSTFVVDPGFDATADAKGIIRVTRSSSEAKRVRLSRGKPDPVLLEVFNNTFRNVATEMGHTLQYTSHSVNIKERLDFSCALFDQNGDLVANAPHIPVHLGSMGDTVREIAGQNLGTMRDGDMYLTNNPHRGGSHLPDMTVVCPVFSDDGEILFYTAARGHHADVGGRTPCSMPPEASHISEEGVVIDNFLLLRRGTFREAELLALMAAHPWPVRNPAERILDLTAQAAACRKGVAELHRIISRYGLETVREYMGHVQNNAERAVRRALATFLKGKEEFRGAFRDSLDDGTSLAVNITISAGEDPPSTVRAVVDFTGTGAEHANDNLNAPLSVTRSAVLYVLRVITGDDLPLNGGCLRPVEIRVQEASLLNPSPSRAVSSGNVETSQRVVDVLLGALGAAAASQGTMNNLLFEVEGETPYYETIAGGSGASPGCPGASAVQVHMTNTRMTDPEVLEQRHPGLRLRRFAIRRGTGGAGAHPGGDGVIREIQFGRPAAVSVISERRTTTPYGLKGGGSGSAGRNLLKKADGRAQELPHRVSMLLREGESIVIETPGGGGYGTPE
jgi:5-oxoprolinase (ATP-hydrolysing)